MSAITVHVQLFAAARQAVGQTAASVMLHEQARIADLRNELARRFPNLVPILAHSRFAAGCEYVPDDWVLADGEELALIPPVSGG